jgi:hypothetical protein
MASSGELLNGSAPHNRRIARQILTMTIIMRGGANVRNGWKAEVRANDSLARCTRH